MINYRLGLDVGTNSLGWSVLRTDDDGNPVAIEATGSRIFSDGRDSKSKATLAADRREARSARRRRDRYKQRRGFLLAALTEAGLFPAEDNKAERAALQVLNPLELRARLLNEKPADILKDIAARTGTGARKKGEPTTDAEAAETLSGKPEYLIGRALFALNQRRGFKSNRKDRSNESDGSISKSISETREKMKNAGARTIGEYLWPLNKGGEQTRSRPRKKSGEIETDSSKGVDHYDYYIDRDMLQDEFNQIWAKQAGHHADLMNGKGQNARLDCNIKDYIYYIIFHQRPLKAQDPGVCQYMENERRGAKALPSIQHHRIYQDLNNLSWKYNENEDPISLKDRPEAYEKVEKLFLQPTNQKGEITFDTIRQELKKAGFMADDPSWDKKEKKKKPLFSLEKRDDKYLNGDKTAALFGHKDSPIKGKWQDWSVEEQDKFVNAIIKRVPDEKRENKERYQTDEEAIQCLQDEYGLTPEEAKCCVEFNLPTGYANMSAKAARLITEEMKTGDKPTQRKAVQQVAEERDDFKDPYELVGQGQAQRLKYYGALDELASNIMRGTWEPEDKWNDRKHYGGVTNPTVHIALNQIRQVVNEIIVRFGKPEAISIELSRNIPSGAKKRGDKIKKQKKQREANKKDTLELQNDFGIPQPSRDDIKKLRLWKEAKHSCPFCSKKIGGAELFNGAEKEHLIPQAYGGQDNWGNLTISCRTCNQAKGGRTPYEAFGDKPDYSALPEYKHWRFQEDAKEVWEKKYKGFLSRQISDTGYVGKLAKAYLGQICPDGHIVVVTGQLTHHLRKYWHLDSILDHPDRPEEERGTKNRNDHRHHAIDAIVVGMATRSRVQRVHTFKNELKDSIGDKEYFTTEKIVAHIFNQSKEERETFLREVKTAVNDIIVSHKAKRKRPIYAMYEKDENDGIKLNKQGKPKVSQTARTHNRSEAALDKKGRPIKINTTGQLHNDTAYGIPALKRGEEVDFNQAINVIHKGKREKITVIPVKDKGGKIYKGFKPDGNWGMEIFQYPDKYPENPKEGEENWKSKRGKWVGVCITKFEANQPEFDPENVRERLPHPAARFVMRLQENDCIDIGTEDKPDIMLIKEINGQKLILVPHNEANADARNRNKNGTWILNGFTFSGELAGEKNKKVIKVKPSDNVSGTYQGKEFRGKLKNDKIKFKRGKETIECELNDPNLKWNYDDIDFRNHAKKSNAWKLNNKGIYEIDKETPGLEWTPDDNFEVTRKNVGTLEGIARKVHISPTGQVSYEKRRKPRRKKK